MAAPVIDANTIVVDDTIAAGTAPDSYTLNFVDKSTGNALDATNWGRIVVGTPSAARTKAIEIYKTNGGNPVTILLKKYTYASTSGNYNFYGDKTGGTYFKVYSEYFNVMPYTVSAADNRVWTENADFVANAPKLRYIVEYPSSKIEFYGIQSPYGPNFSSSHQGDCGMAGKLSFNNCVLSYVTTATQENNENIKANAGSSLVYKNVILTGSAPHFNTGWYPDEFVLDGVWIKTTSGISKTGDYWLKQAYHDKHDTIWAVRNCNFQNIEYGWILQGGNGGYTYNGKVKRTLEYSNNYFKNVSLGGKTAGDSTVIEGAPFTFVVENNKFFNLEGVNQSVADKGFTAESRIAGNYTQLVGTDYGTKFKISGANLVKNWLISADGTNTSSMIQPFTFNGADIADTNTITVEADVTKLNLGAYFANKTTTTADNENKYNAYTDESCSDESLVNIKELPVAAAGAKVYVKAVSPDGLTVSEATYEIIINKKVAYNVGNSAQPSSFSHYYKGNNYYWLGWRGQVEGTGTAASDIANSRVGTLFLSDTANLQTMKDALAAKVAEMTDADDIRTIVDEVNADAQFTTGENANTIKAYTMSVDNTSALTWDSVSQTYGYRYNFSVIEGRYRGTVMFAVYKDSDGVYRITFSDLVVQQAGIN